MSAASLGRLRDFVMRFAAMLEVSVEERVILDRGAVLLADLVRQDDWLPDEFAQPDPERYRQYLLHCDSLERFSVVSFVWAPGQATPVHDHRTWGIIGMLRGMEISQSFAHTADRGFAHSGPARRLSPGDVEIISPAAGDIHCVSNAFDDRPSISVHVYGANIGQVERATYDEQGRPKPFVSGYHNRNCPNIWGRS